VSQEGPGAPLVAAIDVGTNTTRVLVGRVVDGRVERLWTDSVMTRLGAGTDEQGRIGREKIDEVAGVVARFAAGARERGATRVLATGTAAPREAPNGDELCSAIEDASGVHLRLLSGETEARLTFLGATTAAGLRPGQLAAVADIGGGSTEIVTGEVGGELAFVQSFAMGSGRLHRQLAAGDPPGDDALRRARALAETVFAGELPSAPAVVVVGGTMTALGRMLGTDVLDGEALDRAAAELATTPSAELAARHDLDPERARLLPAGLVLVQTVAARLGAIPHVGAGGIREGILIALAAGDDESRW
jgi:exopolyphosphatase/guanosine-5'-triphosphate,3'-diphosphate pyrophosphatase